MTERISFEKNGDFIKNIESPPPLEGGDFY
jgi:hypothetical protein